FTLAADADKFDVPQGGVFTTKITAVRRDYKGPIELALVGIDEKCILKGETIPSNKTTTTLTVTLPESLKAGTWRMVRMVGRGTLDKQTLEAPVETLTAMSTSLNGAPNPPAALNGQFALGIGPVPADFFKLEVPKNTVELVQLLGKSTFTIKATRLEKFADAIALTTEGLPAEFQIKAGSIDKGKSEATLEVTGPRAITEGEYTFKLI